MWKESYRIGEETIDKQHMALFDMTERLLSVIDQPDTDEFKKECENAILFLKNYVIEHFIDEEAYQKSINYIGYTEHCKIHRSFTSDVLKHEKKMLESNFGMDDVKDFAGMVVAWLTYHVADADQKIVKSNSPKKIVSNSFSNAVCTTLDTMAHLNKDDMELLNNRENFKGDIAITLELTGDILCSIEYVFAKEFIFKLIKSFLGMSVSSLDSLTCSILLEFTNIISKNAVYELSKLGSHCSISTPKLLKSSFSSSKDFIVFNTHIGKLELGMTLI